MTGDHRGNHSPKHQGSKCTNHSCWNQPITVEKSCFILWHIPVTIQSYCLVNICKMQSKCWDHYSVRHIIIIACHCMVYCLESMWGIQFLVLAKIIALLWETLTHLQCRWLGLSCHSSDRGNVWGSNCHYMYIAWKYQNIFSTRKYM